MAVSRKILPVKLSGAGLLVTVSKEHGASGPIHIGLHDYAPISNAVFHLQIT
jgi:hypothetical protein